MQHEKIIIYQVLVRLAGNVKKEITPWGSISDNGCGKFNDLDKHFLNQVKLLGANHIWLTGVLEHASCTAYPDQGIDADNPLIIKGMAGSPYAIRDYYDVCPDLAANPAERMEEFEALIARCHGAGLQPIIDFVPNHVARRYHCDQPAGKAVSFGKHDRIDQRFHQDNNFYYIPGEKLELPPEVYDLPTAKAFPHKEFEEYPAKATGNDCFSSRPSFHDWYETVKLNYGKDFDNGGTMHVDPPPATWQQMLAIIRFWAGKGIRGFRCDMAEMVPVEFWQWLIPLVKKEFPGLLFIAESYNPQAYSSYLDAGFDYLYDKEGFYDTVRRVIQGESAKQLTGVWQSQEGLEDAMLRFMENHDEERIASHHFAGLAEAGIPAMAVAATMNKGPLMLYFGQETGEKAEGASGYSGDDGKTSIFDYDRVPSFQKWYDEGACNEEKLSREEKKIRKAYQQMLSLCKQEVIARGRFYDLMWQNQGLPDPVYAYLRWNKQEIWLIAANFSHTSYPGIHIRIPDHFRKLYGASLAETLLLTSPIQAGFRKHSDWTKLENDGIDIALNAWDYEIIVICKSTSPSKGK